MRCGAEYSMARRGERPVFTRLAGLASKRAAMMAAVPRGWRDFRFTDRRPGSTALAE
jgi:hypothetical protein